MSFFNYIIDAIVYALKIFTTALLPWIIVAMIMQKISNNFRRSLTNLLGDNGFIYLTAPGVAIHELSHAFFCLVFRHKINEMKLFSPEEDGTLGYVNHSYDSSNIYQRIGNFFIGIGPIIGGLFILTLISKWLLPIKETNMRDILSIILSPHFWTTWQAWVWLYLAFTIVSHITLSLSDIEGAFDGFLAIVVVILLGCLILGWSGQWEEEITQAALNYFTATLPLLIMIIVISGIISFILKIFSGR
ncbi:MAG: hypothetical protein IJW31_02205 [Lentisphaeria bacterium]|nr:hypothetical protein [Lentisphaeria bacterium]